MKKIGLSKFKSQSLNSQKLVLLLLISAIIVLAWVVIYLLLKTKTQEKAILSSLTPEVGACYNYSKEEFDSKSPLTEPVDCNSAHNAETYRVAQWTDTKNPWKMPTSEITASVEKVCVPWNLPENTTLNYWFYYLPKESDWEAGARWIRCDAAYQITDTDGSKSFGTWEGVKSVATKSTQSKPAGLMELLENDSGFSWQESKEDAKWLNGDAEVYITVEPYGECAIYIFDNQDTAERWTNEISFSSNAYSAWIGTHQATGEGVIFKASSEEAQCGIKTTELLGWGSVDFTSPNYLPQGRPFELCVYSSERAYGSSREDAIEACKYQFARDGKDLPDDYLMYLLN